MLARRSEVTTGNVTWGEFAGGKLCRNCFLAKCQTAQKMLGVALGK